VEKKGIGTIFQTASISWHTFDLACRPLHPFRRRMDIVLFVSRRLAK